MWIAIILICANASVTDACRDERSATHVLRLDDGWASQNACYIGAYQRAAQLAGDVGLAHRFDMVTVKSCVEKGHG
jgi:hypothetical protein